MLHEQSAFKTISLLRLWKSETTHRRGRWTLARGQIGAFLLPQQSAFRTLPPRRRAVVPL
jgi:hypothetical protein